MLHAHRYTVCVMKRAAYCYQAHWIEICAQWQPISPTEILWGIFYGSCSRFVHLIFDILCGNQDNHLISDEFGFEPDRTTRLKYLPLSNVILCFDIERACRDGNYVFIFIGPSSNPAGNPETFEPSSNLKSVTDLFSTFSRINDPCLKEGSMPITSCQKLVGWQNMVLKVCIRLKLILPACMYQHTCIHTCIRTCTHHSTCIYVYKHA